MSSAQQDTDLPPHLLERPEFIEACGQRDFSEIFRLIRKYAGYSNSKIARALETSPSRIGEIIQKGKAVTAIAVIERAADGLHIPGSMLGLAPRMWEAAPAPLNHSSIPAGCAPETNSRIVLGGTFSPQPQEDDPVRRRSFITAAPAALAAPGAIGILTSGPAPWDARKRVSMDEVVRLRDAVASLQVIDDQVGGRDVHSIAARYLEQGYRLLERPCTSEVETAVYTALAQAASWAGWFAHDAGEQQSARSFLVEALHLARISQDSLTEVHAYNYMSLHTYDYCRPQESLRIAKAALRVSTTTDISPRISALFMARKALAFARLGEKAEWKASIAQAWSELGKSSYEADQDPAWLSFFNAEELRSLEALCDADLGAYRHAQQNLESSIIRPDRFERNRALRTARLGLVRLALGDVDGACEAAHSALPGASGSGRVRRTLRALAQSLSGYSNSASSTAFLERWKAVNA